MQTKTIIAKFSRRNISEGPIPVFLPGSSSAPELSGGRPGIYGPAPRRGFSLRQKAGLNLICLLTSAFVLAFHSFGGPFDSGSLLRDGDFESSTPNGTFPDSGAWKPSWLGEAGAVCTTTAARTGNGLWA